MKRLIFIVLALPLFITSCSTAGAEKVADEFHAKLNAGKIDYIMDNLIHLQESTQEEKDVFRATLETVHAWGEHQNRVKTGFNKSYKNDLTLVKLNYEFDVQDKKMYERLVCIKEDDGSYKVLAFAMHEDEDMVIEYTKDY